MADGTSIEWTDATVNAISGCTVISPGCTNCYAMRAGGRNLPGHPSTGLTRPSKAGHVWTGEVRLNQKALVQPLGWKRPRRIFWNAHGDLFHEKVPDEWIDKVFAVCALTPQHSHQILTKRSARMRKYFERMAGSPQRWAADILSDAAYDIGIDENSAVAVANWINGFAWWKIAPPDGNPLDGSQPRWPLPNVWLGVSVEDQTRADDRIPDLLATPAALRWLSCEPLIGRVNPWTPDIADRAEALGGPVDDGGDIPGIDWIVVGGESGPGARDNDFLTHARLLRDLCARAAVPFFGKQNFKKSDLPADLQIREMPA